MYHELKKKHHVEIMGTEILKQLTEFKEGNLPNSNLTVSYRYIESINRILSERVNASGCDVVFFGDLMFIPYLDVDMPIVCVSDITFEQMRPHYRKPDEKVDKCYIDIERLMLRNSSDIIYSSEWIKKKVMEVYEIHPRKMHVVEFGANIPPPQDYSIDIDMEVCNLVFIGVDWKRKGGDKVLETYKILKKEGFPCTLTIVGSVPQYMLYEDKDITIIPKLDKADDKQLKKLGEILRESHFLFLPTQFDAFGIVFCEASAYALPSITANVGGVGQAVNEGENGFLLAPDATARDYADKIRDVFSNKESYIRLRASSRQEFETRLNWGVWGERVNTILEDTVEKWGMISLFKNMPRLSCFTREGVRKTTVELDRSDIQKLTENWRKFANELHPYNDKFEGKGIVICAGGYGYFTCCWVLINTLRNEKKCTLPIQVWYKDDEMSEELMDALRTLDVTCHNISDYTDEDIDGYALKPMAILLSSFKEVLYLDADVVCTINPEQLFDSPEYKEHGAVFWPDFWKTEEDNPIWDILEISPIEMKEQESGQLLIDKERCWKEINLATYFNIHNYAYYHMLYGDKDTFRFAWMARNTPFYFIDREPSSCGYVDSEGSFIGHTMIQHSPDGVCLFLHRNLLKWHITDDYNEKWQMIKRFKPNPSRKEYLIIMDHPVHKHAAMNIEGDVEILNFKNEFGDIEKACLKYLRELRQSDWYAKVFEKDLNRT